MTVQRQAIKRWRLDKQEKPRPLTKTGIPCWIPLTTPMPGC